jgi:hypothetical protein
MTKRAIYTAALCGGLALSASQHASADVSAEGELVLTITLNDVFLINPDTTGSSALGFDLEWSGIGVNSSFFGGGAPSNDPGAIGSNSESETVFFNGVDVSNGDFNALENTIGPGDTIVITQNVRASTSSLDSIFFSQVDSIIDLSFDSFGDDDQVFFFDFDVQASLTGEVALTMPGNAFVRGQGEQIIASAESTVDGPESEFILFFDANDDYYDLSGASSLLGTTPFSEDGATLNIPVEFAPGDNQQTISFRTSLLANAVIVIHTVDYA